MTKFVLSMCISFAILAGTVSRCKIVLPFMYLGNITVNKVVILIQHIKDKITIRHCLDSLFPAYVTPSGQFEIFLRILTRRPDNALYNYYSETRNLFVQYPYRIGQSCTENLNVFAQAF